MVATHHTHTHTHMPVNASTALGGLASGILQDAGRPGALKPTDITLAPVSINARHSDHPRPTFKAYRDDEIYCGVPLRPP